MDVNNKQAAAIQAVAKMQSSEPKEEKEKNTSELELCLLLEQHTV